MIRSILSSFLPNLVLFLIQMRDVNTFLATVDVRSPPAQLRPLPLCTGSADRPNVGGTDRHIHVRGGFVI